MIMRSLRLFNFYRNFKFAGIIHRQVDRKTEHKTSSKKEQTGWMVVAHTLNPRGRWVSESEAILVSRARSRIAKVTQKHNNRKATDNGSA